MEHRKKLINDLIEIRTQETCNNPACCDDPFCKNIREVITAAIYELECSGYPADGVWYIEKRGSSARLILKPEEVEKVDLPSLAILETKRDAAINSLRGYMGSISIDEIVTLVFKAVGGKQ